MATPTTLPSTFTAGQVLTATQMNNLRGAFRVLQLVNTVKTDTFSTSSTTYVDLTGMSASITPSSTTSKILVTFSLMGDNNNNEIGAIQLVRGSTVIGVGDTAGNRLPVTAISSTFASNRPMMSTMTFLDSPATTSATTYKLQIRSSVAATTNYINRSWADGDTANHPRGISTLTIMEISA